MKAKVEELIKGKTTDDEKIEAIYSSPLQRAQETAEILAELKK